MNGLIRSLDSAVWAEIRPHPKDYHHGSPQTQRSLNPNFLFLLEWTGQACRARWRRSARSSGRRSPPAWGPQGVCRSCRDRPSGTRRGSISMLAWFETRNCLPRSKLTWTLKTASFRRKTVFQGAILRVIVGFRECISNHGGKARRIDLRCSLLPPRLQPFAERSTSADCGEEIAGIGGHEF